MTKTMKDHCPTPSSAIRAMTSGLREQSKRDDFRVDMMYFGLSDDDFGAGKGICCGCAATCAIQKATGIDFGTETIGEAELRATAVHIDVIDLEAFEMTIDQFRRGIVRRLLSYYNCSSLALVLEERSLNTMPYLTNSNWEQLLPAYDNLADVLEQLGH